MGSSDRPRVSDRSIVSSEYADERRLAARKRVWNEFLDGPNSDDVTLSAVAETSPRRVLEVGAGWGELAGRIRASTGAEVLACDLSPRMVTLMHGRGIEGAVADAARLPVRDGWADVAVANAMLYHLPDIDAGLAELARVLRDDGRLVATTFSQTHLREIWELLGDAPVRLPFSAENGEEILRRRFDHVQVRTGGGVVTFPNSSELRSYVEATILRSHLAERVPELPGTFQARSAFAVFVAGGARSP